MVTTRIGQGGEDDERAAHRPIAGAVSAAENPAPTRNSDTPAEAEGRRTLSTAFVRVGPDGRLTVELRNGRVLTLRNVVMRPRDYCGMQVRGAASTGKYCGRYDDVVTARPGGLSAPEVSDFARSNPLSSRNSEERD